MTGSELVRQSQPSVEVEVEEGLLEPPERDRAGEKRHRGWWRRNVFLTGAVAWLVLLVACAILGDLIPGLPHHSERIGSFAQSPSLSSVGELLGTDTVGRSNLSRVIYGARISLAIAVGSTLLGLTIGTILGTLAGYYRGAAEAGSTIFANTVAALPPLILLLALVAAIGTSLTGITLALGIVVSDVYIRVVKGAVLTNAQREYVLVAKALGAKDGRIMLREILPNLAPVVAAVVPMAMAIMIVVEGSLSFLGYGIPPPNPSWGGMIAAGSDVARQTPHVVAGPVVTLFLTIFSFNTVGDYLSSRTDVREGQL